MLKVDNLVDNVAGYIENKIDLAKIEAKETAAKVLVKVILLGAILIFSLFTLVFASVTGALAINSAMGSNYLGFLIITGFYLLLLIIAFVAQGNQSISLKLEEFTAEIFNHSKKEPNGKDAKRN